MEERRYWANINETAIEQHRKTKRQQWSTCSFQQWKGETICETPKCPKKWKLAIY